MIFLADVVENNIQHNRTDGPSSDATFEEESEPPGCGGLDPRLRRDEQAEEEKSARDLIAKVEQFASDARGGLYLLDQELAARTYTAPSLVL